MHSLPEERVCSPNNVTASHHIELLWKDSRQMTKEGNALDKHSRVVQHYVGHPHFTWVQADGIDSFVILCLPHHVRVSP